MEQLMVQCAVSQLLRNGIRALIQHTPLHSVQFAIDYNNGRMP